MKKKQKKQRKHDLPRRLAAGVLTALLFLIGSLFGYTMIAKASGDPMPAVFGWGSAVVLSGSMEPKLPVGALLVIHREKSYEIGDIVTYEDENGSIVTHRLTALENGEAVTKGDANNIEDAPFPASKICGKVRAVLPGVGGGILWLKTPSGICAVLLLSGLPVIIPGHFIRKVGEKFENE